MKRGKSAGVIYCKSGGKSMALSISLSTVRVDFWHGIATRRGTTSVAAAPSVLVRLRQAQQLSAQCSVSALVSETRVGQVSCSVQPTRERHSPWLRN